MSATTQCAEDCADIDFAGSAACHYVDFALHHGKCKDGIRLFHLDHLVNEKRKIGKVVIHGNAGYHNVDAVNGIAHRGLDQIIEIAHLFRADLPGDQVGDHVDVCARRNEESGRLQIFRGGG